MSPSMHRRHAREMLRGNWPTAVLVTLVAALLGGLEYSGPQININFEAETLHNPAYMFLPISPHVLRVGTNLLGASFFLLLNVIIVCALVHLILGGAIEVGYCRYQLNLHDGKESSLSDLFSFMDHFGSALCMNLIRTILVTLGTICFFIPGLVLSYGLSMAGFIMAEDPDCGAVDALKRSWQLMNEHKMDLLILDMTFFGWMLLSAITLGIGLLFVNPYSEAARASFYRELKPQSRYSTYC